MILRGHILPNSALISSLMLLPVAQQRALLGFLPTTLSRSVIRTHVSRVVQVTLTFAAQWQFKRCCYFSLLFYKWEREPRPHFFFGSISLSFFAVHSLSGAENRTRDGWVGSANAYSVLCRPPNLGLIQSSQSRFQLKINLFQTVVVFLWAVVFINKPSPI